MISCVELRGAPQARRILRGRQSRAKPHPIPDFLRGTVFSSTFRSGGEVAKGTLRAIRHATDLLRW
ncbi:MAG: hypothetical protein L0G70_08890, partial [Rubrobacter sp.]|nr:hypothetical protein [Rubrobacter sp.]